jgi:hypothetical protein
MAKTTSDAEEPSPFTYPANAREIDRPDSPLKAWYGGAAPEGTYVSRGGVVTTKYDADQATESD